MGSGGCAGFWFPSCCQKPRRTTKAQPERNNIIDSTVPTVPLSSGRIGDHNTKEKRGGVELAMRNLVFLIEGKLLAQEQHLRT
jgi:hypothetical protein